MNFQWRTVNKTYARSSNKFSAALYDELAGHVQDGFLVSPTLLETALALIGCGSRGGCTLDILHMLHLSSCDDLEVVARTMATDLSFTKLYLHKDVRVKAEFREGAAAHRVDLEQLDLSLTIHLTNQINEWLRARIRPLNGMLGSRDLEAVTDAVLVNVGRLRARWAVPFLVAETRRGTFLTPDRRLVEVEVMNATEKYYNYRDDHTVKARFVEIPFAGEDSAMVVVLPHRMEGLARLEKKVETVFKAAVLEQELLNISLPKFIISSKHLLKGTLQNIGLHSIFRKDKADLGDIVEDYTNFTISEVVQGVTIDVTENGVGVPQAEEILIPAPSRRRKGFHKIPKNFNVDRPFLFFVKINKVIIYIGRILAPKTLP